MDKTMEVPHGSEDEIKEAVITMVRALDTFIATFTDLIW
jgi:hypothetical protein